MLPVYPKATVYGLEEHSASDSATSTHRDLNSPDSSNEPDTSAEASSTQSPITDPILRQKLSDILKIDETNLTIEYIESLKYGKDNRYGYFNGHIDIANGEGIESLEGLQYFGDKLTVLSIRNASLRSLSPIDTLHRLHVLSIRDNRVTISDISALINLNTDSTELTANSDERLLRIINLSGNTINVENMPESVSNKLRAFSSSAYFSNTRFVKGDGSDADDRDINKFLTLWSNPTRLSLDRTNIRNLDFMKDVENDNLKVINVENNPNLSNIDGINRAANLLEYYGRHTRNHSNLDVFNGLSKLQKLYISYNDIYSAGQLNENNFNDLRAAYLGSNHMKKEDLDKILAAVKSSSTLEQFHMDKNLIADISPLNKYEELRNINFKVISFQMNNITDFSPLDNITSEEKWVGGQYLMIAKDTYYTDESTGDSQDNLTGEEIADLIVNPENLMPNAVSDDPNRRYPTGNFNRRSIFGIVKSPNMIDDILNNPYMKDDYKELIRLRNEPENFYKLLNSMEEFSEVNYDSEKPFLQLYYRNPDPNYYNGEFKMESGYVALEMPKPVSSEPTPTDEPNHNKPSSDDKPENPLKTVSTQSPNTGDETANVYLYVFIFGSMTVATLLLFSVQCLYKKNK